MTIPAILSIILLAAMAWQIWKGLHHVCRHEAAKRRAARIVFPPQRTIEISDELPF